MCSSHILEDAHHGVFEGVELPYSILGVEGGGGGGGGGGLFERGVLEGDYGTYEKPTASLVASFKMMILSGNWW